MKPIAHKLFLISLYFSSVAFANNGLGMQPQNPLEQKIYEQSLSLCSNITDATDIHGFQADFNFFIKAISESLVAFNFFVPNKELDTLMRNRWFHLALEQCFPNDTIRKQVFVGHLYLLDFAGKVAAGAIMMTSYKYIAAGLEKFAQTSKIAHYAQQTLKAASIVSLVVGLYEAGRRTIYGYLMNRDIMNLKAQRDFIRTEIKSGLLEQIDETQFKIGVRLGRASTDLERSELIAKLVYNEKLRQETYNRYSLK